MCRNSLICPIRKTFIEIVNLAKTKKKSFKRQPSASSFPEVTLEELGVATVDDEYDDYTSDEDGLFPKLSSSFCSVEEGGKYTNPILEQPWVAPSWEYARSLPSPIPSFSQNVRRLQPSSFGRLRRERNGLAEDNYGSTLYHWRVW